MDFVAPLRPDALDLTPPSRSGCNPRVPQAGSLSLGSFDMATRMKTAKCFGTVFLLIFFSAMQAHARLVRDLDRKTLMEDSQLVFVGKVKSVKPSGITTEPTRLQTSRFRLKGSSA